MKTNNNITRLIISIFISMLFLTSCGDHLELPEENEQMSHTVKMTLDGSFIDFDGTSTRASYKEWRNGDILYLEFYTSNGYVRGKAIYDDNSKGEWTVSYNGTLDLNTKMTVTATFLDNPSLEVVDNAIKLTPTTAIYWSQDRGTAIYSSTDELSITITMKPEGSRIRFKGTPGDEIMVAGLNYCEYFYFDGYYCSYCKDNAYLTVNESGYTDYLYDYNNYYRPTEEIKIKKREDDGYYLYTLDRTENMLVVGKSGWMNIPNQTSCNGWTMKQVAGEENGYLWVDLGLPSGTKWAVDNVGADIAQWQEDEKESNVYGQEYYWGQTSPSTGCREDEDIQGSDSYDTAKWRMKGKWVMPSYKDYTELLEYCNIKIVDNAYGTINTIEVSGDTGEFIDFPYDKNNSGTAYWTSSPALLIGDLTLGATRYYAYVFDIDNLGNYELKKVMRCYTSMGGGGITNTHYYSARLKAVIKDE